MQQIEGVRPTMEDKRGLERNIKELERRIIEFNEASSGVNIEEEEQHEN